MAGRLKVGNTVPGPLPGQNMAIAELNGYVAEMTTSIPGKLAFAGGQDVEAWEPLKQS